MKTRTNFAFCLAFVMSLCHVSDSFAATTDDKVADSCNVMHVNVENAAVQYFLHHSDAQFGEKRGSIDENFFDQLRTYRPDQPSSATINFTEDKAKVARVFLKTEKEKNKPKCVGTVNLIDGKGSFELKNLVPGQTYCYSVVTDRSRKECCSGRVKTTGALRMISLESGFNIRDLGGWKGLDGRSLRYGRIYRGGSLGGTDKDGTRSDITPADKAELRRLGINAFLDLRASTDGGKYAGESSFHSYSAGIPPVDGAAFNNTMTDYGAYNEDASVISDVAWVIYQLQHGRNVYFNCRQGADRTGTVAFVLEGLLGCYEYGNGNGGNQMALDYELTGFSQANLVDNVKVTSSCRPASEAYSNTHKLFRQLIDLEAAEPEILLATLQEKCYYYLNRYSSTRHAKGTPHIDSEDLDWFIRTMLDMPEKDYVGFKPKWAAKGEKLKTVAVAHANVTTK